MSADYLAGLNRRQQRAVKYEIEEGASELPRPLLILAGAGTGKTRTLARRVAHLLKCGASPRRILLLAFGNRAAAELSERVKTLTRSSPEIEWAGTFHSIGARLLRRYASLVGLQSNFTIMSRKEASELMDVARLSLSPRQGLRDSKKCVEIYSYLVNTQGPLDRVLQERFPACIGRQPELHRLFRCYEAEKKRANVADFDDLLRYWLKLLNERSTRRKIAGLFDHVLVDEFQDVSRLQAKILLKFKPDGRGLTVVGDDAQAIYSFRGADVRNIRRFPAEFEPQAKVIKLEENYRSTPAILAIANAVIQGTDCRKELWSSRCSRQKPRLVYVRDGTAQAVFVANAIAKSRRAGVPLREQAVLFREAEHSLELEQELRRRNIPFRKHGGRHFQESPSVQKVLTVLRWCENPRNTIAGIKTVRNIPGIGTTSAARLVERLEGKVNASRLRQINVPRTARCEWQGLIKLVRNDQVWHEQIEKAADWLQLCGSIGSSATVRRDIKQLGQLARDYSTRRAFLAALAVANTDQTEGKIEDYVTLSTVHSAKGREWREVTIIGAVDGYFPSSRAQDDAALEEEGRLFHVALTRAQDMLTIIVPEELCKMTPGRTVREVLGYLSRTPFLDDQITAERFITRINSEKLQK
jgi:DNA helicase-2/ATP-dependent DNA helicase PcrA